MGHRTLSLRLIFEALFLQDGADHELRQDDNPFVEGLFLVVLVGVITALLAWVGQLLTWASTPQLDAIKQLILNAYQRMPWWAEAMSVPGVSEQFQRFWNLGWQVFPVLFHAPNPTKCRFQHRVVAGACGGELVDLRTARTLLRTLAQGSRNPEPNAGSHGACLDPVAAARPGVYPLPGPWRRRSDHMAADLPL